MSHKGLDVEAMTLKPKAGRHLGCARLWSKPGKAALGAVPKVPGLAGFQAQGGPAGQALGQPPRWPLMSGCVLGCLPWWGGGQLHLG